MNVHKKYRVLTTILTMIEISTFGTQNMAPSFSKYTSLST